MWKRHTTTSGTWIACDATLFYFISYSFFLPTCSHSLGEYLYSKYLVAVPCFASFYSVLFVCFSFARLLIFFISFLILWLNFALSDESDSQSSFRLMSWHCQNRCLAISCSIARCVLESVQLEVNAHLQIRINISHQWLNTLCIHINSLSWCVCVLLLLQLLLLQHGAMLIVFSYVLLHIFRSFRTRLPQPTFTTNLSRVGKLNWYLWFFFSPFIESLAVLCIFFVYLHFFTCFFIHLLRIGWTFCSSLNYATNAYPTIAIAAISTLCI